MPDSVIAVIPARGGSKRVPRKNVRELLGKPMIGYAIEAALESALFSRVLVSTDCEEIASVAKSMGAEVPFLRNPDLADDITPVSAATVDMLQRLDPDASRYNSVCQLMANCPLCDANDIRNSYRQFISTGAAVQMSVVRYGWQNPWWSMRCDDQYTLDPMFPEALSSRSQDLPELFCPTGAIWWAQAGTLRREGTFHIAGRKGCELSWQHGIDIDTEEDWEMATILLNLERSQKARNRSTK